MSLEALHATCTEKEKPALNAEQTSLLISFCNQMSSPNHSFCILDPSNGDSQWIDLSDVPEVLRQDFSGITGICHIGKEIVIATQGATPALVCVNIIEAKVASYVALEKSKDTHSLVLHNGYIYLVSTGTNEIYRVSFHDSQFGREELVWGYPGVSYDKNEIHLNGLTIDEDRLIASCFGSKRADGSWDAQGRVFYVESGDTIQGGLHQPHSPLVADRRLIFAESAAHKIYVYDKAEHDKWDNKKEVCLTGYTRGIALVDDRLWVGISADRKLSRSQRKLLNDGQRERADSSIVEIDLVTGRQVADLNLVGYGREAYDILPILSHPVMLPAHDAICTRIREMELSVVRYATDLGRLFREQIERDKGELVTVIIPSYNRAHLIGESIRSVLAQTYINLEVIVVDDGSTDNTEEAIAAISDPRLRYICQQNRGRSNARNHALSLAGGKYIAFLDSDDLYLPNKIELQVAYLKSHPGVGMVYTSAHCIDDKGEMLAHKYEATKSGLIYESIAFFTPVTITLPTVMTYKTIMDHVGNFDENLHRFEDTDMWRRISKSYRIDAMREYTCKLRTHDDNSLLNQCPDQIASALEYYSNKIIRDDVEISLKILKKGLAALYRYYGHALMTVPQFYPVGKKLMRAAYSYDPALDILRSVLNILRPVPDILRYWTGWYARFVYYRTLNVLYRIYSKAKKKMKKPQN